MSEDVCMHEHVLADEYGAFAGVRIPHCTCVRGLQRHRKIRVKHRALGAMSVLNLLRVECGCRVSLNLRCSQFRRKVEYLLDVLRNAGGTFTRHDWRQGLFEAIQVAESRQMPRERALFQYWTAGTQHMEQMNTGHTLACLADAILPHQQGVATATLRADMKHMRKLVRMEKMTRPYAGSARQPQGRGRWNQTGRGSNGAGFGPAAGHFAGGGLPFQAPGVAMPAGGGGFQPSLPAPPFQQQGAAMTHTYGQTGSQFRQPELPQDGRTAGPPPVATPA